MRQYLREALANTYHLTPTTWPFMRLLALMAAAVATISVSQAEARVAAPVSNCAAGNAGLKLPSGFCATLFADSLNAARHMDVAPNGDVIVGIRSTRGAQGPVPGGVIVLRDADGDGR